MKTKTWLCMGLILALTACSAGDAISLLTGGGPNVAANTQLGQVNEQVLGVATDTTTTQSLVRPEARDITQVQDTQRLKADRVETVVNNESPYWLILLALVGWLLPSPGEIGRTVRGWFKKSS